MESEVALVIFNFAVILSTLIICAVFNHKELKHVTPNTMNPERKWYYWPGMLIWAWFGITFIILLARVLWWYACFLWKL